MKKLTQTEEQILELLKNSASKKINFDCGEKGKLRQIDAALKLAGKRPKTIKAVWQDFRYFSVELISA